MGSIEWIGSIFNFLTLGHFYLNLKLSYGMNLISFTMDTLTTFFVPGARLSAVDTPVSSKEYPYHNKTQSLTRLRTYHFQFKSYESESLRASGDFQIACSLIHS